MDWERYYQDQIKKSYSKRLNKVSDFVGNRRGFMRSFGIFLGKESANVIKGLLPNCM